MWGLICLLYIYLLAVCFCFFVSFLVNYLMCVACFIFGALVFFVSIFKEDINLLKSSFFPVNNKMNRVRGGMQLPTVSNTCVQAQTALRDETELSLSQTSWLLAFCVSRERHLSCVVFGDKNSTFDSCLRSLHRCKQVAFYYLQKNLMKIF